MLTKQVSVIDDRGCFIEPRLIQIAENLEEAKLLNYPITKRLVRNENPRLVDDSSELQQLRGQIEQLRALPKSDIIEMAIAQTEERLYEVLETIETQRIENEWIEVEEYIIPPIPSGCIEEPIPLNAVFWLPKWDGAKWTEGLSPEEIEARIPTLPDWNGFVLDWFASDLDEAIATTTKQVWLTRLQIALDKRPNVDLDWLILVLNRCIEGMPEPLTKAQIKTGKTMLAKHNIPLAIGDDGTARGSLNFNEISRESASSKGAEG